MEQIETGGYIAELKEEGCHTIYKYGIACFKKKAKVMIAKEKFLKDSKTV